MGMPLTGKRFETQLIDIIRFGDDGLAHEHWGVFDQFTMLQQLGVVPAGPPAQLVPPGSEGRERTDWPPGPNHGSTDHRLQPR